MAVYGHRQRPNGALSVMACTRSPRQHEPPRILVVGAGRRGREHITTIAECNGAVLAGIVDTDARQLEDYSDHVAVSSSVTSLLSQISADPAVVSLPHGSYLPILDNLLTRGLACLKEKPFARSLAEAEELAALDARSAGRLMIAAQRRHGTLLQALSDILHGQGRRLRAFEYVYTLGLAPGHQGWRSDPDEAGGGAILDMGYHVLDSLTALFRPPSSVAAFQQIEDYHRSSVENGAVLLLQYPNGATGTVILSRHLRPKAERATFWFDDETLLWEGSRLRSLTGPSLHDLVSGQKSDELLRQQFHAFLDVVEGVAPRVDATLTEAFSSMITIDMAYRALQGSGIAHSDEGLALRRSR